MASTIITPVKTYSKNYNASVYNTLSDLSFASWEYSLSPIYLIQCPAVADVDVSTVKKITLTFDITNITENEIDFTASLGLGMANNMTFPPADIQYTDITYNAEVGTQIFTFNVSPTIDISRTWYLSILNKEDADANYGFDGTIQSIEIKYGTDNTVKYYYNGGWVDCVPYYYDNGTWVKCVPYYYNGSSWIEINAGG